MQKRTVMRAVGRARLRSELLEPRQLLSGSIVGLVYTDVNRNGVQDSGDAVAVGQAVYLDANNNGSPDNTEVRTTTDGNGWYSFPNLDDGTYTVRAVFPATWEATAPAASPGGYAISVPNLVNNQTQPGPKIGGSAAPAGGTLSGYVFSDLNGNGVDDGANVDATLAGGRAFLDNNGNGVLDAGTEPVAAADGYGNFTFTNLAAGQYTVGFAPIVGYGLENYAERVAVVAPDAGAANVAFPVVKASTSIRGTLFNDANLNGQRDVGETPSTGGAVYVDVGNVGQFQPSDPIAQDVNGSYAFVGLPNGTYVLRATGGTNFVVTGNPSATVTLPTPAAYVLRDFGMVTPPTTGAYVAGTIRSATTSAAIGGVTVYLDNNANGQLDSGETSVATDAAGAYRFALPAGAYTVREVPPNGYAQTAPAAAGGIGVTVTNGAVSSGHNFVLTPPASILGTMYNSTDGGSIPVTGEAGLSGYLVYIDSNNNDQFDSSERSALTQSDGSFLFAFMPAGTYTVRQVVPSGYATLNPASGGRTVTVNGTNVSTYFVDTRVGLNASASGTVFADANRDGLFQPGEAGVQGAVVWDDANNDGKIGSDEQQATTAADGTYRLHDLYRGTHNVRVLLWSGQVVTGPAAGSYAPYLDNNQAVTGENFGSAATPVPGGISGTVFDDTNANAVYGSDEPGLSGWRAYLDLDADGAFDHADVSTLTDAAGHFAFANLAPRGYAVAVVPQSPYQRTTPAAASYTVTVGSGQQVGPVLFGERSIKPATIGGVVYADANGNGQRDAGEAGLSGVTLYNDVNNNGQIDPGELLASSLSDGSYQFAGLSAGSYRIREVVKAGATQVTPSGNAARSATVATGQSVVGQDFGQYTPAPAGSVAGTVTANGVGLAGVTVYLDANNDGVPQTTELKTTTAAGSGTFGLSNVPVGSYVLRQVSSGGYTQVTPSGNAGIAVSVTAGAIASGKNFVDVAPATSKPLTGTTIGTAGSYANSGNTIAKATDGSLSTFFDGPGANGNWVGLDLGAAGGVATSVRFASRGGWAGRMNGGQFQASNSPTFAAGVITLYTIGATANPSATALTTAAFANATAYRYYRYLSPAGSFGDVSEVQFVGTAGGLTAAPSQLTGTTIGTAGSYANGGNTVAKATDGNLTTYFDGPGANGNWVGLDLGSVKSVSQFKYAPRSGWAGRMVGGSFQVSTTADFSSGVTTVATITATPAAGVLTTVTLSTPVTARYVRYLSPAGSYGDVAEVAFFG